MFEVALDTDVTFLKVELDLPLTEANLFKLLAHKELEARCCGKRVHVARIGSRQCLGNVHLPRIADLRILR